jgi:hypothetical protein
MNRQAVEQREGAIGVDHVRTAVTGSFVGLVRILSRVAQHVGEILLELA